MPKRNINKRENLLYLRTLKIFLETCPDFDLRDLLSIFPEHTDDRNFVEFIHLRLMKGEAIKSTKIEVEP
jgi:hypothetical protein